MNKKRRVIVALVLVVLLVAGGFVFGLFGGEEEQPETTQPTFSQLTGIRVDSETAERPILSVIIENSEAARPQTGLGEAGIVFEAITEGGITRYLALYQENQPDVVGPVRSLRGHFLDWAMGFDASIAHVGGSAKALELADERDAKNLNEFQHSDPYYRDNERDAPHNMFAHTKDLQELQEEQRHGKSQFTNIPRSDENPSQDPQASSIAIDFSSPTYSVEFRYEPSTNSYVRHLAGSPHVGAVTTEPITVKNVIVIKVPAGHTANDGAIGSGEALIFKDGNVINARWEKSSHESRIRIIDAENNEVPLNRGKTWVPVVPVNRQVTYQ